MSAAEDENQTPKSKELNTNTTTTPPLPGRDSLMDLDFDLGSPWPFDQICSSNTPSPSFLPFDQLWSSLSTFPDDKPAGNATSTVDGGHRVSDRYPRLLSCNSNSVNDSPAESGDKIRVPSPILRLTRLDYPDWSWLIKEKMAQALRFFKESTEQHFLAQVWAPVKNGGRYVLTTSGQPFVLGPHDNVLHQFRMVSLMYMFSADGESGGALGLPGRVFQQKLPEWTPNVQYYSNREYPRLPYALNYNVQGSLALPVFEPSRQSCIGVLELITTSQKINYAPEVDIVCKALEAVNLKSSEILDPPNTQFRNEGRQKALAEILEILTVVCETQKLPLAQTWVPCMHRSILAYGGGLKKSCSSFDGSCMGQVCMSTTDVAFYVVDAHMWGFREACAEHHLQRGQGVAGRAFASQNSCFCEDITQFSKSEYPLVHYARMFGLTSSFAICLQSTRTGNDDYILEFFLPPHIRDNRDQQTLLGSILVTMKQHFQSLKVASSKEREEEGICVEIIKASMDEKLDAGLESVQILQSVTLPAGPDTLPNAPEIPHLDSLNDQLRIEVEAIDSGGSVAGGTQNTGSFPEPKKVSKEPERKRGKAEKSISLEVLQQYFAGSLKDAAKSLGVCPTTMKRICRQHGISRWPSRKIKKVNHSLSKLKRVIESVHGTEGAFTFTSLTTNSIPVAVGPVSWPSTLNGSSQQKSAGSKPSELIEEKNKSMGPKIPRCWGQAVARNQMLEDGEQHIEEAVLEQIRYSPELRDSSSQSKTGSASREESTATSTSLGSCQGSPCPENESLPQNDRGFLPIHEIHKARGSPKDLNLSGTFSFLPDVLVTTQPQEPFGGTLVEDAGSSPDLRNPCPAAELPLDEQVPEYGRTSPPYSKLMPREATAEPMPHFSARSERGKTVTIKATYKENIIRFRLSLDSGMIRLKEEVATRLKLEMGTFDIKYLDDDHEWVLIACDADLQECVDVLKSSGSNIIRLSVYDVTANLGSSCESSGK